MPPRAICFVTGTRAEFGLMESTLCAIQKHSRLQIIATGIHLSRQHGHSLQEIRKAGFQISATVPWKQSQTNRRSQFSAAVSQTESTGLAIAHLSRAFAKLKPDIVLVVGDRVEAFGAATAAHLSGIPIAHIHGGDRALGQVDDSLRHAITKLSHIHFPATKKSAERIKKLGEDAWRIHHVGSPGIDGIVEIARQIRWRPCRFSGEGFLPRPPRASFSLVVLHPTDSDTNTEFSRAEMIYQIARKIFPQLIIIYPNNDPGSAGIIRCWKSHAGDKNAIFFPNIPRPAFLALLRDTAVLIGNSSSGIIEAASFGTPVLDIGPRQQGREHGPNVFHSNYSPIQIRTALKKLWNNGTPRRFPHNNIYGNGRTSEKIAKFLQSIPLDERLKRKLIAY